MYIEDATVAEWLEQCDYEQSLPHDDERYTELKNRVGEDASTGDWLKPFERHIMLQPNKATCQVFSGYIGTGKSTCLNQLAKRLKDANYLVLFTDAADYHDLQHPLAVDELMILIAGSVGEHVAKHTGEGQLGGNYWHHFLNFLKETVGLQELDLPIPRSGIELKMALRSAEAPFWKKVSLALSVNKNAFKDHIHTFIENAIDLLLKNYPGEKEPAGIVYILDSLERLRGDATSFLPIMESAVQVFSKNKDLLLLPKCHTIYTVPPYLEMLHGASMDFKGGSKFPLPAIKVEDREGNPFEPGIMDLAKLVAKRIPLEQVFGVEFLTKDLPKDDEHWHAFREMIIMSGGHVRTLLKMVNRVIFDNFEQEFPVTPEAINKVIDFSRQKAEMALDPEGDHVLLKIYDTHSRNRIPHKDLRYLAQFMENQSVLWYQNGGGWFGVNPLLRKLIEGKKPKGSS